MSTAYIRTRRLNHDYWYTVMKAVYLLYCAAGARRGAAYLPPPPNLPEETMKYSVLEPITISSGDIGLTALQASLRKQSLQARKLDKKGNGTYTIIAPIYLKRGEIIEISAPDKAIRGKLKAA